MREDTELSRPPQGLGSLIQRAVFCSDPFIALDYLTEGIELVKAKAETEKEVYQSLASQIFYRRCVNYMWLNWLVEALADAKEGARLGRGDLFGLLCESTVKELEGKEEEAAELCEKAVRLFPTSGNAKVALSYCLCKVDRSDAQNGRPAQLLNMVIHDYKNKYPNRHGLAYVPGETDEDVAIHASELSASAMAWNNLAVGLSEVGDGERALEAFKDAVDTLPVFKTLVGLARHLTNDGTSDELARQAWDSLVNDKLERRESKAIGLVERSRLCDSYGMMAMDLLAATRLYPNIEAFSCLAYAMDRKGMTALACKVISEGLQQAINGGIMTHAVQQLQTHEAKTFSGYLAWPWTDKNAFASAVHQGSMVTSVSERLTGSHAIAIAYANGTVRIIDLPRTIQDHSSSNSNDNQRASLNPDLDHPSSPQPPRNEPQSQVHCVDLPIRFNSIITSIGLSPNLEMLAVGTEEGYICIYDISKGVIIASEQLGHAKSTADFSGVFPKEYTQDGTDNKSDTSSPYQRLPPVGVEPDVPIACSFSQCGEYIIVGSMYGIIYVFRLESMPKRLCICAKSRFSNEPENPIRKLLVVTEGRSGIYASGRPMKTKQVKVLAANYPWGLNLWTFNTDKANDASIPVSTSTPTMISKDNEGVELGVSHLLAGLDWHVSDFCLFPNGMQIAGVSNEMGYLWVFPLVDIPLLFPISSLISPLFSEKNNHYNPEGDRSHYTQTFNHTEERISDIEGNSESIVSPDLSNNATNGRQLTYLFSNETTRNYIARLGMVSDTPQAEEWHANIPRVERVSVSPDGLYLAVSLHCATDPIIVFSIQGTIGAVFPVHTASPLQLSFCGPGIKLNIVDRKGEIWTMSHWQGNSDGPDDSESDRDIPLGKQFTCSRIMSGKPVGRLSDMALEACKESMVKSGCFDSIGIDGTIHLQRWHWISRLSEDDIHKIVGKYCSDFTNHLAGEWPQPPGYQDDLDNGWTAEE